ncbi:MAG: hypothetical protein KJ600_01405 [Nanoarchaeota archaeon]|nr:hypothetical protein [Nanoarchaeota archaeon]
MMGKNKKLLVFSTLILVFSVFMFGFVSATDCWQYASNATGQCTSANGCIWKSDSWGSWCEELNCWSLWTQDDCSTVSIANKNCSWQGGGTNWECMQISCWIWDGTDEATCVNNTNGRSCEWREECFSSGGGSTDCWGIGSNQSLCQNTSGCSWGGCMTKSCWEYTSDGVDTCNAKKDPWSGRNCTYSTSSSTCMEDNCGSYELYPNSTACNAASHCNWQGSVDNGWCGEIGCWSFDGNQTGCTNASTTHGLDCSWSSGYCMQNDCWSATTSATCGNRSECIWDSWTTSGWCNEVNCWSWDSMAGGSEADCNANATLYGLSCNWVNMSGGTGWCETDFSSTNCTGYTNEGECYGSYYCWWQANDWSNSSAGGNCSAPDWSGMDDSGSMLNQWNPGCYIFDNNMTECGWIIGCDNSTSGSCNTNATHLYNATIDTNGLNCTMINDSGLCNDLAALSTCCSWQGGICTNSEFSSSCWNGLSTTPSGETSCEDAATKANCDLLAANPWYWPCTWNNSTSPAKCTVKTADIWGNNTKSLVTIENEKMCESVGGKWITENYCAGNVSVPTGRCEYKFSDEKNCNKACFACEYKSDGSAHNSSATAKTACEGSLLGFCEFTASSGASNGYGICKAKAEFTGGVTEECSATNCGGCTYKGTVGGTNGTTTPENWCNYFPTACKWIADNSTATSGYCIEKSAQVCEDTCDRCDTQTKCTNNGRTSIANQSGSCKWQGSDSDGNCVANIAGTVEVCWNGEDDDSDALIDCADPGCFGDSFCGMAVGDCFIWSTESDCNSNSCEWIVDNWGSWCDHKGTQCWKYDGSQSSCQGATQVNETLNITLARLAGNEINESYSFRLANLGTGWVLSSVNITNVTGSELVGNYTVDYTLQTINFTNGTFMVSGGGAENYTNVSYQYYANTSQNCKWENGSGSGWCEQDWSIAEVCMNLNRTACADASGSSCVWTNDTWCNGGGNGTDWCTNYGGWCDHSDFVMKDCWQYDANSSCSGTDGCNWRTDEWSQPHCEVNWSGQCWSYMDVDSCGLTEGVGAIGCAWRTDSGGSWCDNPLGACWSYYAEGTCNSASQACTWQSWGTGGEGNCQPACLNMTLSDSECAAVTGCVWKAENGWCEEQQSAQCWNSTNSDNQTNCDETSGCKWRSPGWCSPKDGFSTGGGGGGGGGTMGAECWKYDGNQTLCTNSSIINISCGWSVQQNPWCEVDWNAGGNCWQYSDVASGCNSTNNCWFKSDEWGSYCTNIMDQCWSNLSLTSNATACNENAYCNATDWGGCEPTCFSSTTQELCGSGCRWLTGWCNPAGMNQMFDQMETGAPVPLGMDGCGTESISQASVDICGFGMKDMGDAYGFGANVYDFSNSSVCNKIKLSSFVMDMQGGGGGEVGGPGAGASEKTGAGTETVKYLVYLDTDGSTTGSCSIESNNSAVGYEFKLRYASVWNVNTSQAAETFTSYKCENSNWKVADIKINTWKQKMCSELGGPMIAIEKGELSRFPELYSSTSDMRVFVVTIGNTGNVTTPTDTAGPGWATPGAIDFEIAGAMEFGANSAKFEKILEKGFVAYEDCYNGVDDDDDGDIDCADWSCEFSSKCAGVGVNIAGFSDTTMPVVKGVRVEEYPDGALLMFEASKPVNGTLKFYENDSQCLTLNATIYDVGVRKNNTVREYKLWQEIQIYNDGGVTSLGSDLSSDTNYYYKLKICDTNNRCALSKCSSFRTNSATNCGFCNYVLKLKEPTGWTVSYDTDTDGAYDHEQGAVCGTNAGMKMNYTLGRAINIKLAKDDGTVYFEFLNASVSKTGLNDKVRDLTTSGDSIIGTSTLVGLNSQARDKIINNLHPEVCRIKIPFTGVCETLYHCDDNGANCVDRTSSATLLSADTCLWEVPFCEFSTYYEYTSGAVTPPSSGGGSSGGGSATVTDDEEGGDEEDDSEGAGEEEPGLSPDVGEETGGTDETSAGDGFLGMVFFILGGLVVLAGVVVGVFFLVKKVKH